MRSLRLDEELDQRVRRAAAIAGETVSEFIRRAAARRAEQTLADADRNGSGARQSDQFADVLGAVRSGGGRARRTSEAFTEELLADRAPR